MRIAYLATIAALGFANLYLRESSWHSDINIHSILESVATTLAIVVGCLSLVRYYSKKDNMFLFIGAGFIGTACLDGYHTLVSSVHFIRDFPSTPAALIAWSWLSSRMFLAVLLWLSWLFWRREARLGGAGRVPERVVIGRGAEFDVQDSSQRPARRPGLSKSPAQSATCCRVVRKRCTPSVFGACRGHRYAAE